MKRIIKFKTEIILAIIFAIILIASSSCKNLVPYTDALKTQRKWTNDQMTHAQFYLSQDIELQRTLTKDFPDAIAGKIVIKDGVKKEIILIPRKTPIIFTGITETGAYSMQCDQGDARLTFGVNPNLNGQYVLLATEWKNDFGKVHYDGKEYFVSTAQSQAHLLIDLRKRTEEKTNFHVAKGVKI